MGGGISAYDLVNAGEKLDAKAIAIFADTEEQGGEGRDIDEDDGDLGNTCLTQAIKATIYNQKKRYKIVENILQRGSDVNQLTMLDETPLHTAAYMDRPDLMTLLIANKADINNTAQGGWAPIHFAALAGNLECIEILLNQPGINVHGTVGAKYSGKNAMDLAFLRLNRTQHENALSYENDEWTYEEITHKTRFYKCFTVLDNFINAEVYAKAERKRQMRRIVNPFEPIYDRKGRRKVYCTLCRQGYWSRSHNKFGQCPECRGNEADEARKIWEATHHERMLEREQQQHIEAKENEAQQRKDRVRLLYGYPDRNEQEVEQPNGEGVKDVKFEYDIANMWNAALNTRALLAAEGSLNKKYYTMQGQIGNSDSAINQEQNRKDRLKKEQEAMQALKPKYKLPKLW
tara:strand:- start:290 stop:1498 length:1209 start_codon:yes stop_codon:yes gene_type:complete